ncbi:flavin-containing monooxygenase [Mycetocola reblochoni]|uniref:FAD-dependent oxidoreductase n=1 Tax=Mycetocola reblochoni TaxID=331618 RepID=A0A3L6ZTD3_9MICO|nr:NAD(P)/FAD-dependent oxidoreductase [Mycetocola reblochoni]RLP71190.1 FAD-dependent oxidoreductase [Mycetocola reblochoni]
MTAPSSPTAPDRPAADADERLPERTEVVVVGGGQAGVAMSEHLASRGIAHVVLERDRIAEAWRTRRWDSLVANGPAWHDRFPGMPIPGAGPDDFVAKDDVAAYFTAYVEEFGLPVVTGVEVLRVTRNAEGPGFTVATSAGTVEARYVVAATGPFQVPVIPALIPADGPVAQLHSHDYRNPGQLAPGGILVVGAGSSGVQIAAELRAAGREVALSVGPHDRPPRRYRDRDFVWWLGVLNKWDAATPPVGASHVTIAVSGADGGRTVDFRELADAGITLLGRTTGYRDGVVTVADDLRRTIARGDENYLSLLREADAYVERNGLDLPEEPEAHLIGADPACVAEPLSELDLAAAGITTVIWATGYTVDYSWLEADAFTPDGRPDHLRGVSREPGVYFLGLPWQSRRGSSFIWGVWHDAKHIAEHIATQRSYLDYRPSTAGLTTAGLETRA